MGVLGVTGKGYWEYWGELLILEILGVAHGILGALGEVTGSTGGDRGPGE